MAKKSRGKLGMISPRQPGADEPRREVPQPAPSIWELMYGPATPIGPRQAAKPAPVRTAPSQSFLRPTVEVDKYINTEGLFSFVRDVKKDPNWRAGVEVPIMTLANPSADPMQVTYEVAQQFKLPEADLNRYGTNAWQYLVEPFIKQLEKALNLKKPQDLPGTFKFQFGRDRSFGLSYGE